MCFMMDDNLAFILIFVVLELWLIQHLDEPGAVFFFIIFNNGMTCDAAFHQNSLTIYYYYYYYYYLLLSRKVKVI